MSKLLEPIKINNMNVNNRLVMPPLATEKSLSDGRVTQELLAYYDEKSRGGYIGLIIIEHSFVVNRGKASKNQLSVADDGVIPEIAELAKIIQKNGCRAVMQINHAGGAADSSVTGENAYGPSEIANPRQGTVPFELSKDQIIDVVYAFAQAASRVKEAGFDAVEIHSAHGYLLNQFFSPLTNHRTDEYGGSLHNRIRIHLEIIKAVKKAVGDDFPVLLRLGACDYIDGGITIEDSILASKEFERAGVDAIDVSGGFRGFVVEGMNQEGFFSKLSHQIKKNVSIPVILTGGVVTASGAEQLLMDEKADMIGVGRAILKDSMWAKNAVDFLQNR